MDKYKILISEIGISIKPLGFKKTDSNFYCNQDNNIGLINFQKSNNSSSNRILFTINIGVYSNSLKIFGRPGIKSKPLISDCHWRQRIGFLLPQKQDYWWDMIDSTSLPDLINEIVDLLNTIAIPEIKNWISDESLEDFWMCGISSGLTEPQMYLYLIALLKMHKRSSLNKKVEELKQLAIGKPFQRNIHDNLIKLGIDV